MAREDTTWPDCWSIGRRSPTSPGKPVQIGRQRVPFAPESHYYARLCAPATGGCTVPCPTANHGFKTMSSDLQQHSEIEVGSNRSFGLVFFVVFLLIGLYPLIGGNGVRLWSLIIAGVFLFFSFVFSEVLRPLNTLWFKFGMLLAKIVNPIVMFVIYVLTIVPFGLGARLFGKDLLRIKLDKDRDSYWEEREPPGPEPESLKNQF